MGFLYLSSPLGMTIGLALGGYIAGHFHWRTAFFVVGVPGVVLALVAAATLREPRREPAEMPERAAKPASPSSIRSEENTSELQSLMRISYAVFCLNIKTIISHILLNIT